MKIEYKLLENFGCGFYDNDGNFCYMDKEGNVVVCKDFDDEGKKGVINLIVKVIDMGKVVLEKIKDLIEGSIGGSIESIKSIESSKNDVNKNVVNVSII